jgi:hypothetical protein
MLLNFSYSAVLASLSDSPMKRRGVLEMARLLRAGADEAAKVGRAARPAREVVVRAMERRVLGTMDDMMVLFRLVEAKKGKERSRSLK